MCPPTLSIIVALYQVETLLPEFLVSLSTLLRDEPRVEAVLVDDGSNDNTGRLAREFENSHDNSRVVRHTANKGLFCARQTGVNASKGQFVWLVDGDDVLLQLDLEFIVQSMISYPKLDLFCFQFIQTGSGHIAQSASNCSIKRYKSIAHGRVHFPLLYWGNIWRFVIRRNLLIEYYRATMMRCDMGEDLVLTSWLGANTRVAMLADSPIYLYRKLRPGSYTETLHPSDRIAVSVELFYQICVCNTNSLDPVTLSMLALFSLPMRHNQRIEAGNLGRVDLVKKCLAIDDLTRGISLSQSELAELIEQQSIGLQPAVADARASQIIECLDKGDAAC